MAKVIFKDKAENEHKNVIYKKIKRKNTIKHIILMSSILLNLGLMGWIVIHDFLN